MSKKTKARKLNRCENDFQETKKEIGSAFFKSVANIIVHQYKEVELSDLRQSNNYLSNEVKKLRGENQRLIESLYSTKNLKLVENFLSYLDEEYDLVECKGERMCGDVAIIDSKKNECVATASDFNEDFVKCETCDAWICSNHSQKCYCERKAFCQSDNCSPENCQHDDCNVLLCDHCSFNAECSSCYHFFCKEHLEKCCYNLLCGDCLSEHNSEVHEKDHKE